MPKVILRYFFVVCVLTKKFWLIKSLDDVIVLNKKAELINKGQCEKKLIISSTKN